MPALNEFDAYCQSIDVPAPIRERTGILLRHHAALIGKEPSHLLLENSTTAEGMVQFIGLCCLVDGIYVDLPMAEPNWKCSMLSLANIQSVGYIRLQEVNFVDWNPASQMIVDVRLAEGGFHLTATGMNCRYLSQLVRDQIIPRLKS